MSFNISVNNQDRQEVLVNLEGKLFVEDAALLRKELNDLIDDGHSQFTIDMQKANYIDSSGLGVLVAIHKKAVNLGGGVVIKGLNGAIKDLFQMTRLNKVFDII